MSHGCMGELWPVLPWGKIPCTRRGTCSLRM
jgi:hypothetical protein